MITFDGIDDFAGAQGRDLGTTAWLLIDQDRIDAFAASTDDNQWIHIDPVRAAQGPFGTTIAHGLLTLSLLPRFHAELYSIDNVAMRVNYGLNKVRFPAPVLVGSRLRAVARVVSTQRLQDAVQGTVATTIEIEGAPKPACVAESVVRVIA